MHIWWYAITGMTEPSTVNFTEARGTYVGILMNIFYRFFFVCDWNFTSELRKTSTIICTNHFPECTIQNSFSFEHLSISYVQQKKDDVRIKEYFFKIRKTATVFKRERIYLLEQRFLKIQIYFSKTCITNFSFLKWYYESFQFFKSW